MRDLTIGAGFAWSRGRHVSSPAGVMQQTAILEDERSAHSTTTQAVSDRLADTRASRGIMMKKDEDVKL